MPDTVVSYMNAFAGAQKRQVRRDPSVVFRGQPVRIDDDAAGGETADDAVDPPRHQVPGGAQDHQPDEGERPARPTRQHAARERMLDRMVEAEDDFADDPLSGDEDQLGGAPPHFREPSFEDAPDGYDDDDASSATHSDNDSLDDLLDAFDPDEVYDRGRNVPHGGGESDQEEPIPDKELQRNREQLHASGYHLRRRQPGRYANGIFRPERVEVGLHITFSKALNKFKRKALIEMYREIRQIDAKKVWHL
jgi:hypothetical protein